MSMLKNFGCLAKGLSAPLFAVQVHYCSGGLPICPGLGGLGCRIAVGGGWGYLVMTVAHYYLGILSMFHHHVGSVYHVVGGGVGDGRGNQVVPHLQIERYWQFGDVWDVAGAC